MLLARHVRVQRTKIVELMERVHILARDAAYLARDRSLETKRHEATAIGIPSDEELSDCELAWPTAQEGPPPPRCTQEDRTSHCNWLQGAATVHVSIPAALGLGHTNISSKVAASMYSTSFECSSWAELESINHGYRAMCTDMGTELGITSFSSTQLRTALPEWHPWRCGPPPVFCSDDTPDTPEPSDTAADDEINLMPNAVAIPGICHLVDNLLHDMDVRLTGWTDVYDALKNTSALLCQPQARRRVWRTCVQKAQIASHAFFELSVPSL